MPNIGYSAPLDGLRAVAVMLVLMVHANYQKVGVNGGLGVSVFFALSGFLITTLLLEEFRKFGDISFKGFYMRRTMRLFPALYVLLVCVLVYAIVFSAGSMQTDIFHDVTSSALYVYNIKWFWGWGTKEILLYHTWSLGVEEQFYLLWPCILFICMKKNCLKSLQICLLIFILATWALKTLHVFPFLAGSIIQEPIFLGCAAALLRWNGTLSRIPQWVAIALLGGILVVGIMPFKIIKGGWEWAFNICGLCSSLVILHLVYQPTGSMAALMGNKRFVFLGKISYSLYLWHLPVFRVFFYNQGFHLPPLVAFFSKIIVSFVLAILSWYTIEKVSTAYGRKLSNKIANRLHEKELSPVTPS